MIVWALEFINLGFWIIEILFAFSGWDLGWFGFWNFKFMILWSLVPKFCSTYFSFLSRYQRNKRLWAKMWKYVWWFPFYRLDILLAMLILHFYFPVPSSNFTENIFKNKVSGTQSLHIRNVSGHQVKSSQVSPNARRRAQCKGGGGKEKNIYNKKCQTLYNLQASLTERRRNNYMEQKSKKHGKRESHRAAFLATISQLSSLVPAKHFQFRVPNLLRASTRRICWTWFPCRCPPHPVFGR